MKSVRGFTFRRKANGSRSEGFTLIELLVVIAIIAVLSAIALVNFGEAQKGARDTRRKQDLRSIQAALEIYYQKNYSYPTGLSALPPTYIDNIPLDPKNVAPYIYVYTDQTSGHPACPPLGQWYALSVNLERQTDPDRNASKFYSDCHGGLPWADDAFVITSQD